MPCDFKKSFAPITTVALVPNVLVVNAKSTATNAKSLVALAKSQRGKLSYGSNDNGNGNGTVQHLIGTQFAQLAGVNILHVPYKVSAPLTTNLLGGQVDMSFDTLTPLVQYIKGGKLRALAVTTAKRSGTLPDVPTLAESGLTGFDQGTWVGILGPTATPKEIVTKLNAEMVKIIKTVNFKKRMDEIGAEPVADTPAQAAMRIKDNTAKYAKLVKDSKVVIQ